MSTCVLMRILESSPRRYDAGIRLFTLGRVDEAYNRLADHIQPGQRALDLGKSSPVCPERSVAYNAVPASYSAPSMRSTSRTPQERGWSPGQ